MYGLGANLSYEAFVAGYLNKINPSTGLIWRNEQVASATGTPLEIVNAYVARAQEVNYQSVVSGGGVLTDSQIAAAGGPAVTAAPPPPPPVTSAIPPVTTGTLGPHGGTVIGGIEYFGPAGQPFKPGIDLISYWNKNGHWYRGDNLGNVVEVSGIGGGVIAAAPPNAQSSGLDLGSIPAWAWIGGGVALLLLMRRR